MTAVPFRRPGASLEERSLVKRTLVIRDAIAVVIASLATRFLVAEWLLERLDEQSSFYPTIAQIAASLLGFIIAGLSIALFIAQDQKFRVFRESPHYPTLWAIFGSSTRALGALTLIAIAGIFTPQSLWLFSIVVGTAALSAWATFQVVHTIMLMTKTISLITRSVEEENESVRRAAGG